MKRALYFGYGIGGHFLRGGPRDSLDPECDFPGFPWNIGLLDTGLLKNRGVPDLPDGRVHWTLGGRPTLWFAFVWWDRSGDHRGASNSGFYVEGFAIGQENEAFAFACEQWPDVVKRQLIPLVLVDPKRRWPGEVCKRCGRRNCVGFIVPDETWEAVARYTDWPTTRRRSSWRASGGWRPRTRARR